MLKIKILTQFLFAAAWMLPLYLGAQSAVEEPVATWQRDLAAPELDATRLQGFQVRAQQKVQDFADLLTLLSGGSLDPALRKEAEQAVLRLFFDPSAKVTFYDFQQKKREPLGLKKLLTLLQKQSNKTQVAVAYFSGNPPTSCIQPECTWELNCIWTQTVPGKSPVVAEVVVTIVLKKTSKDFGGKKKEAWEVFLSEFKPKSPRP